MFIDDLVVLLVSAGVGVYGTNIFASSKSQVPDGDGPFLSVKETGGTSPDGTHNAVAFGLPGYQQPGAQLLARALTSTAARAMADAAYAAVVRVGQRSQLVNGVWWKSVQVRQEPADFGLDDKERQCFVFNISVIKRPNAAMSQ